MSHKPKPIRDHYVESLSTNSQNLSRQLADMSVAETEIKQILDTLSAIYLKEADKIAEECERDIMALEMAPSPLSLFVTCISQVAREVHSPSASSLLQSYVAALEEWM